MTKMSREVMEDSTVTGGIGQVVSQLFAKALAAEIDRVAILGDPSGGGDPDEPTGVAYNSTAAAAAIAAGGAYANYDKVIDGIYALKDNDYDPSGIIGSVRTERDLAKLKTGITGDNTSLTVPDAVKAVPRFSTTKVPANLGAGTDESIDIVGDWSNLWIGMRTQLQLLVLNERYADTGEIGLVGWLRADVQVAQTGAFSLIDGIL